MFYIENKKYGIPQIGLFRVSATDDNPCDLFDRIDFPVARFSYRAESLKTGLLRGFYFTQKCQCGLFLKSRMGQAGKDLNFR